MKLSKRLKETKAIISPKHPDWLIWKEDNTHFSMQHKDYDGYLIEVFQHKGQWLGEIMTEQSVIDLPGEMDWMPAQSNPLVGPVEKVKAEVIRRGQYWASRQSK